MIVVDTHIILWLAQEPDELSALSVAAIEKARAEDGLAISDKSLWEIAMLVSKQRVVIKTSLESFLQAVESLFTVLPITSSIAARAVAFSSRFPLDPSDRIIGATANVHGIPLVTADRAIRASGEVDCIW